jgi:hypothetical protein
MALCNGIMNEDNSSPDPGISALLREARVAPALPPRFSEQVWRRIEHAGAPAKADSWLDALANLLFRPRWAVAAVAILVLVGALVGTLDGRSAARQNAQMTYLAAVAPQAGR